MIVPVQIAALCADIIPEERPSMQDIVEMLKDGTTDIVKPPSQQHGSLDGAFLFRTHPVGTDVNTILVTKTAVI